MHSDCQEQWRHCGSSRSERQGGPELPHQNGSSRGTTALSEQIQVVDERDGEKKKKTEEKTVTDKTEIC